MRLVQLGARFQRIDAPRRSDPAAVFEGCMCRPKETGRSVSNRRRINCC